MSLVEYLDRPNWQDALQRTWSVALDLLKRDRFAETASSVDDLRSWLTAGGVSRVRLQLQRRMTNARMDVQYQHEVLAYLSTLVQQSQTLLLDLMAQAIIPSSADDILQVCGLSEADLDALVTAVQRGEQPVMGLLRAHGYSEAAIQQLYVVIDTWLAQQGIRPMPGTDPRTN
jgi:hypothetical protein